jgi:uncharacterized membrane-anchored protein YhcB (DUF1043 family)
MLESLPIDSPLLWIGAIIPFVALVWLLSLNRANRRLVNTLRQNQRTTEKELEKCNKQMLEVRSVLVGLGQRVTEQQELIQHLTERVSELENIDNDGRLYTRASKMVKLGAGLNELIEECELPKAEAELMMSLQNKIVGKEKVPPLQGQTNTRRNQGKNKSVLQERFK